MLENLYYEGQTKEEALFETKTYLKTLLESAQPMIDSNLQITGNTTLKNVRIDSFQYVINKTIELLDKI